MFHNTYTQEQWYRSAESKIEMRRQIVAKSPRAFVGIVVGGDEEDAREALTSRNPQTLDLPKV